MNKYQKYKPAFVDWVEEIPINWKIVKTKHVFHYTTGFTPPTGQDKYFGGNIVWVTIADMNKKIVNDSAIYLTQEAIKKFNPDLTNVGSLLFSFKLSVGKVAFAGADLYTNEAIISILPDHNYDVRYYYYSLPEQLLQNANENIYGAKMLNQELIRNASICFPPKPEQTAIANYLDEKTAQIDTLIAKKQQLIDLLKEERTAVINNAVTKGINPNVKLKPCGIEWLGEIPEHWDEKKLKRVTKMITNGFVGQTRDILIQDGVKYIQSLHVKKNTIIFEHPYYVSLEWSNDHSRSILKEKDILVVQTGAGTGNIGIVPKEFEGCNCHALIIIRIDFNKSNPDYIMNLLTSNYGSCVLKSIETGALHPHLNSTKICDIDITLPPINEQSQIVMHIATETQIIDSTILTIEKEIELMQEYRTALISEVVTGKVKVVIP